MAVKRGLFVAPFDELVDPRLLGELARTAEARGWDGFFLWDHVNYRPPVRAVADGVVKLVRTYNIHGGTVAIDHGQGLESMYLHLSKFAVAEGTVVHKGDVIGYSGSTGRSNAPHLHWSLYANGVPVNPGQWVAVKPCAAKH